VGVTREDRIRNEYTSGSIEVASIVYKMRGNRFRWFGHFMRGEDSEAVRTVRWKLTLKEEEVVKRD